MFKQHTITTCFLLCIAAIGGYYYAYETYAPGMHPAAVTEATLQVQFRKLFAEQVIWTRNYLIAAAADHNDLSPAADRLLANAKEIGYAFIPYYGKEAGRTFAELLRHYTLSTMEVIATERAQHQQKLEAAYQQWQDQIKELATFLNKENPRWDFATTIKLLEAHKKLTTEEITARLHKAWKQDINAFSKVLDQALMMADYIGAGIAQQFPQKL